MWLGRSQQKSTTSSDFGDFEHMVQHRCASGFATAAGFTGYATAAEPSIGVVGVVSVVSGVCVVVTDVQPRLDSSLSVMSRESFRHVIYLVSWLRRAFRVHESSPRAILTCNLQGFVAPEGVSSAREQPEGNFDM